MNGVVVRTFTNKSTTKHCPLHIQTTGSKYCPPHKRPIASHSKLNMNQFYAGSPIFSMSPSPTVVPLPSYIIRKTVTLGAPCPVQN
ncbi:hypothetical protein L195_g059929 [Trifolium pratense]|uniref:Uncharacterized protein n=1 Tax=Trifolium pratense TaxID=57577 RepID=A0A2K3K0U2_TRIPR|nr:hypothetical protein L195_g059929 [Trifolium pratense]